MFYVYQLRLETSERPFYIGKGKGKRKNFHLTPSALKGNSHKNNVIRDAMRKGVKILTEIIHDNIDEQDAFVKEIELIAFYGRRINGGCLTNATDGGEGASGRRHTEAAKRKIAESKIGIGRTPETKAKISTSLMNPTPDRRERLSSAHKGVRLAKSHANSIRFSNWDRNDNWFKADVLYAEWVTSGRPGWRKSKKLFADTYVEKIYRLFSSGWVPENDPLWVEYVTTRRC